MSEKGIDPQITQMTQIRSQRGTAMESDPRTYAIIGAAMEVHRQLGCGFLEAVYQEAMESELAERGIPFDARHDIPVRYKGRVLKTLYRPDFLCFDTVVVELKALTQIGSTEEAQVLNYLRGTGFEIGLLINFGRPSLQTRRFILTPATPDV
jgi:GxxExxY protein